MANSGAIVRTTSRLESKADLGIALYIGRRREGVVFAVAFREVFFLSW